MTILIVEDNTKMRASIRQWISERLPQVRRIHECADGGTAVTMYKELKPDWILMDLKLQKTDGLTASRDITAAFPDARIIILTNHDDPAFREEARSVGVRWYILKEDLAEVERIVGLFS